MNATTISIISFIYIGITSVIFSFFFLDKMGQLVEKYFKVETGTICNWLYGILIFSILNGFVAAILRISLTAIFN